MREGDAAAAGGGRGAARTIFLVTMCAGGASSVRSPTSPAGVMGAPSFISTPSVTALNSRCPVWSPVTLPASPAEARARMSRLS